MLQAAGRSTAPGGKLRWEIRRIDGSIETKYLDGTVTATAEAGQSGAFSLSVSLGPGNYEVRVSQLEEGNPAEDLNVDTRGFTVK